MSMSEIKVLLDSLQQQMDEIAAGIPAPPRHPVVNGSSIVDSVGLWSEREQYRFIDRRLDLLRQIEALDAEHARESALHAAWLGDLAAHKAAVEQQEAAWASTVAQYEAVSTTAALLLCAWIVAFFPILSNTVIGLRAADANLRDLFRLYRATPWQRLRLLRLPAALPYFVAGLKISGGLSLIGAVTAEMVAGAAGRETGLASRILEASFRTETPKMFAALTLLVLTGVLIFALFNALSRWLLGPWHASESHRPP